MAKIKKKASNKIKAKAKKAISKKKSATKKTPPKKGARRPVKKDPKKAILTKTEKPIGRITHFYGHLRVAIVKFKQPVRIGAKIKIKGATTKFEQKIASMQFDHKPIKLAAKNKLIGIRVVKKTREGDLIYKAK